MTLHPNRNASFLAVLEDIIAGRLREKSSGSYVASLAAGGDKRLAQKVAEEAVEVALAVTAGDRKEQLEEAADLVFHLLVLLKAKDISLADVAAVLEQRHALRSQ
ncbi:MAG: phosphoribosyl-ATP diphosphatase [Woeseia sp.]